jgi:hypothetical protein
MLFHVEMQVSLPTALATHPSAIEPKGNEHALHR